MRASEASAKRTGPLKVRSVSVRVRESYSWIVPRTLTVVGEGGVWTTAWVPETTTVSTKSAERGLHMDGLVLTWNEQSTPCLFKGRAADSGEPPVDKECADSELRDAGDVGRLR